MAQPPMTSNAPVRSYQSPPRDRGSWTASRPGEFDPSESNGAGLGSQGPDQGYVLSLAHLFEDELVLTEGEHHEDAIAGCAAVAMKRAALFGRGPVVQDLRAALEIWGFLDQNPPQALVDLRKAMFAEAHHAHHYPLRRDIADTVPSKGLHQSASVISEAVAKDWRALLALDS